MTHTVLFHGLASKDAGMHACFDRIADYGCAREPVLILGESGTGKEALALSVHRTSRRTGRFVPINCGTLLPGLADSELFGHVEGAFTGARRASAGAFGAASGGTLFLDEVGELGPEVQVRLLRVLEAGAARPLGGAAERPVDVRVVAATHRDLSAEVRAGRFRADLFHRLHVLLVEVPPLRDRPADVELLCERFLSGHPLSPLARSALLRHPWPGNVRELKNVLTRARLLASERPIEPQDLMLDVQTLPVGGEEITSALTATRGNRAAAARLLGWPRSTLCDRIRRYGIAC